VTPAPYPVMKGDMRRRDSLQTRITGGCLSFQAECEMPGLMRNANMRRKILLAVVVLLLASCGKPADMELSGTVDLLGFGFSMDYPGGWSTAQIGEKVVAVAENEWESERLSFRFDDTGFTWIYGQSPLSAKTGDDAPVASIQTKVSGYQVIFTMSETQYLTDKVNGSLMRSDVAAEPLREFFEAAVVLYGYAKPKESEISEIEIFGVPAISGTLRNRYSAAILILGHKDDVTFSLRVLARSRRLLKAFMPTWEEMLESIELLKE
jgi:hypothetical protein